MQRENERSTMYNVHCTFININLMEQRNTTDKLNLTDKILELFLTNEMLKNRNKIKSMQEEVAIMTSEGPTDKSGCNSQACFFLGTFFVVLLSSQLRN